MSEEQHQPTKTLQGEPLAFMRGDKLEQGCLLLLKPEGGYVPFQEGDKVLIVSGKEGHIFGGSLIGFVCGIVKHYSRHHRCLELRDTSAVCTPVFISDVIREGCKADGWGSVYEGRSVIMLGETSRVVFMSPEAEIPTEDLRHENN